MSRWFILLIIVAAFSLWTGFALRGRQPQYSKLAFIIGGILALLAIGGFFGLL